MQLNAFGDLHTLTALILCLFLIQFVYDIVLERLSNCP